ncbi:MAG: ATP-binding protein [Roseibium album]|uniref:ATP-binding protein n=1 Tax=Roseibium album TaxID=311410 RepID=UPI0032EFD3EA
MKLFQRIHGPRLGTKIMLLGLTLLIVPWFSYRQLVEMERLLIQGQSNALLLTAEGISTLFNGREDLFNDLPVTIEDFESLYAHPLQNPVRLDGRVEDWGEGLTDKTLSFGSESGGQDGDFQLLLGERGGQLYVFMNVIDPQHVYRSSEYLRLDNADHVRLRFIQTDGEDGRVTLTSSEPGVTTAYEMDADWRFAETGTPSNEIQGFMEETDQGFRIEFRMPLSMLGSSRYFGVAFVDVDDPDTRAIRRTTQTLPTAGRESFDLVVLRSPEVLNIIQGLGYSGARILVIDPQKRVRAETGSNATPQTDDSETVKLIQRWFSDVRPWVHRVITGEPWEPRRSIRRNAENTANAVINSSLSGDPLALRRSLSAEQEVIMAAHPIVSKGKVIGTVVVEQNINEILSFQRAALEQVILVSIVSLFAVFIALLAFAARLAWRIRSLRREASSAIDEYGRLQINELRREMNAGDEIGDLARSVSNMLSKLHQHNNFLESMPRTLRHEINNPLNTLSTSLQNLAEENPEVRDSKYLESAKRGVMRIGIIVQNLADAANLEESLEAEEREVIDIAQLLENYIANCKITHKNCEFVYRGPGKPVYASVSDYRIEQLLDKIIDNAIDFHRSKSPIKVQLDAYRDTLQITVANRGPTLPQNAEKSLFDSMVSHRGPQNRLHFGLGLYVVRVIAEHHGGFVRAVNLADGSGVAIMVQLPMVESEEEAQTGNGREAPRIAAN